MLVATAMSCSLAATSVLLAGGAIGRVCFKKSGVPASRKIGRAFDKNDKDEAKEEALGRDAGAGACPPGTIILLAT